MSRSNLWSSLAIGLIVLVSIPILARCHVAFTGGARSNAQGAAAPRALSAGSANAVERPFFSQGIATVRAVEPGGIKIQPAAIVATQATAAETEPRQRVLHIQADSDELGGLVGLVSDTRVKQTCRFGSGELYTAAGDAIRFALKMKADADSTGQVGTYHIFGGTGRFRQARGSGSVIVAAKDDAPAENATFTLSGTISY